MFLIKKKIFNKGFMMVEVLIAISIILAITLTSMSVVQRGISVSEESLHVTQASSLLEEGGEAVRIYRDSGWSNIANLSTDTAYYPTLSGNTWILSTTQNNVGLFTRTVTISNVNRDATTGDIVTNGGVYDAGTKLVTVNVSWQEGGQAMSKKLLFYISNIFS